MLLMYLWGGTPGIVHSFYSFQKLHIYSLNTSLNTTPMRKEAMDRAFVFASSYYETMTYSVYAFSGFFSLLANVSKP